MKSIFVYTILFIAPLLSLASPETSIDCKVAKLESWDARDVTEDWSRVSKADEEFAHEIMTIGNRLEFSLVRASCDAKSKDACSYSVYAEVTKLEILGRDEQGGAVRSRVTLNTTGFSSTKITLLCKDNTRLWGKK